MDVASKQHWELEEDGHPCNTTDNPAFASVLAARLSRCRLLTGATTGLALVCAGSLRQPRTASPQPTSGFVPVTGSTADTLITPPGYVSTRVLLRDTAQGITRGALVCGRRPRQHNAHAISRMRLLHGTDTVIAAASEGPPAHL